MKIEKYVAAPAAASFNYVQETLPKSMRLCYANITSNSTAAAILIVYQGAIAAWNVANHRYSVWGQYYVATAGATFPGYRAWLGENIDVELPAGTYTFAYYAVGAGTNVHFMFELKS